jgi:predicted membrane-bound dolichyl-phosphate-mannose-protein mannosyltransferase
MCAVPNIAVFCSSLTWRFPGLIGESIIIIIIIIIINRLISYILLCCFCN